MDQKTKKTTNMWWVYQKRSKFARRIFSTEVTTIPIRAVSMMYPVHPGPVTKLATSHPAKPRLFFAAICAKLFQCAKVCTQEKKTIDQAVVMWNVMFLSNWMIPLRGVCRPREMSVLQTGNKIIATSKCSVRAAARAMGYVRPNVLLASVKLSLIW